MQEFTGAKAALITDNDMLVVFLRDNKPGLRFANLWDFPGGGREGNENPFECLKREVEEEFAITLNEEAILWQKLYPAMHDPAQTAYFFAVRVAESEVAAIRFGTEGQRWTLMSVDKFLGRDDAVPFIQSRLKDYLDFRKSCT